MGTVVISAFEHTVKDQIKTDAKLSRPYGPEKEKEQPELVIDYWTCMSLTQQKKKGWNNIKQTAQE